MFFGMMLAVGGMGIINPFANAADTVPSNKNAVQTQSYVEHMRILTFDDVSVMLDEIWYNPATGYERNDQMFYDKKSGKIQNTHQVRTPKRASSSLFRDTLELHKYMGQLIGTVTLNGKQVQKRKGYLGDKGDPTWVVAYIDSSTGLPVKKEYFSRKGTLMRTARYFFDHVNDPDGVLFQKKS